MPVEPRIYLWQGDITTLKCGAIVNAANSGMAGCYAPCHGCIDNAIHTYAGVQLRLACAEMMKKQGHEEPTGSCSDNVNRLREALYAADAVVIGAGAGLSASSGTCSGR